LPRPLIVLDTGVVVSALVGPEESPSSQLMRAVATGEVVLLISDAFLSEVSRVVGYPDVEPRIVSAARAFRIALDLGVMGTHHHPPRYDWPSIEDPGDGWMLDLAWSMWADYIVTKDPHLLEPELPFPIDVRTPAQFLHELRAVE
jgi:putative PIN family toxin of toxin-antitoxin system